MYRINELQKKYGQNLLSNIYENKYAKLSKENDNIIII